MNDLGLALVWLSVQVTLLLIPAVGIMAWAARRGAAAASWVMSLTLVLVLLLSVFGLTLGTRRMPVSPSGSATETTWAEPAKTHDHVLEEAREVTRGGSSSGATPRSSLDLARLRIALATLEQEASAPAVLLREWGKGIAVIGFAGIAVGIGQLVSGVAAVWICRRRSRPIHDGKMQGLFDTLCAEMRCRTQVALREVADLSTPATAGWLHPVVLLPHDWREWTDEERRAVLAHELAHVVRRDYGLGLVARLAVALNFFHPLVRWFAGRLQFQQELAADALGAEFAGGRQLYLLALSRLALKQDARIPNGPARAFLPRRGTLIRRIQMLKDVQKAKLTSSREPGGWRIAVAAGLVGLTVAVGLLRGPARGDDGKATPPQSKPAAKAGNVKAEPFPLYVPRAMRGMVVIRPAAALQRVAGTPAAAFVSRMVQLNLDQLAKELHVDTSKPEFLSLSAAEIEWITAGIGIGRSSNAENPKLHSLMLGGVSVRTTHPVDWRKLLTQWRLELEEAMFEGTSYLRVKGPSFLGPQPGACLIDDRTLIFDEEARIRAYLADRNAERPAYLSGDDWKRVSGGLLAVAIDNAGGVFAKDYNLDRPDDAVVLKLFQGVNHWVFGIDDHEDARVHALASLPSESDRSALAGAVSQLVAQAKVLVGDPSKAKAGDLPNRELVAFLQSFLSAIKVKLENASVEVRAQGFATLRQLLTTLVADNLDGSDR